VVLVAERLEGGPVNSRVSTFPETGGWIKMHRFEENHGFDGDWCLESLVTIGAFVKQSVAARKSEVLEEGVVFGL